MPSLLPPLLALVATLLGVAGLWTGAQPLAKYATVLLLFGGAAVTLLAPTAGFISSGLSWPRASRKPRRLQLGRSDWLRAPIMWLHAFRRSWAVEPGLYFTGSSWDPDAPLLVTGNYLLTVLVVSRAIGPRNVRLLVVDSDGINVWCASGKGQLSARVILSELERYPAELLGERPRMVLPKLSLAGVNLAELRAAGIRPVVGPVHARDLPAYLDNPPLKNRRDDRMHFGLAARTFSWLPGLVQYLGYGLAVLLALLGVEALGGPSAPIGILAIVAWLGTAYPLLFPWIPGQRFAVKGLWLGGATAAGLVTAGLLAATPTLSIAATALFTVAMAIFVGLSFTGNSAVSNHSEVRKEIAHFLPLDVILFVAAITAFLLPGSTP